MRALVREVPESFPRGLTTAAAGLADVAVARAQHRSYCRWLESVGCEVLTLTPDEAHPDSCFVEDTAVRLDSRHLVLARPGHPSRRDEVQAVGRALAPFFAHNLAIEPPGHLDGGDVLRLELSGEIHFVVGLSTRTDAAGAGQFARFASDAGHQCSVLRVEDGLHLKTACAFLGHETVLCWESLAEFFRSLSLRVLTVSASESYAANAIRVGERLLIPRGFPHVGALLSENGFVWDELTMSEFQKQDGGLSCLSILF